MIEEKTKGFLIVVSGPSGAGKDSICNKVAEDLKNVEISISMTSREPRKGEEEGKNYYYISKEEFEDKIKNDEFLEYAVVHNNQYYGTPKKEIEEKLNQGISIILVIDIQGALKVKEIAPEAIFIFIMPPSMEVLKERLLARGTESNEKVLERFKRAYQEINEFKKYNYVIVNDNLSDSINSMKAILLAEKSRVDRIEDIYLNTSEEFIHEGLIDKEFDNPEFKFDD
ncbi:MAG: guanylate kinase [Mollicutes bacterium]|nr:guanylate kinase [Mollicutes bacterium]